MRHETEKVGNGGGKGRTRHSLSRQREHASDTSGQPVSWRSSASPQPFLPKGSLSVLTAPPAPPPARTDVHSSFTLSVLEAAAQVPSGPPHGPADASGRTPSWARRTPAQGQALSRDGPTGSLRSLHARPDTSAWTKGPQKQTEQKLPCVTVTSDHGRKGALLSLLPEAQRTHVLLTERDQKPRRGFLKGATS